MYAVGCLRALEGMRPAGRGEGFARFVDLTRPDLSKGKKKRGKEKEKKVERWCTRNLAHTVLRGAQAGTFKRERRAETKEETCRSLPAKTFYAQPHNRTTAKPPIPGRISRSSVWNRPPCEGRTLGEDVYWSIPNRHFRNPSAVSSLLLSSPFSLPLSLNSLIVFD